VRREFVPDATWAQRMAQDYAAGKFLVVHLTSSKLQRKATWELMVAWKELLDRGWEEARLLILCHPLAFSEHNQMRRQLGLGASVLCVAPGLQLPTSDLVALYQSCHVVCQPSRAEGFGLVPLEARACGTPVVATAVTGHAQHLCEGSPGAVIVEAGPAGPIDDYRGATAPSVTPAAIVTALRQAREQWAKLHAAAQATAPAVSACWGWARQIAPAMTQLCLREESIP